MLRLTSARLEYWVQSGSFQMRTRATLAPADLKNWNWSTLAPPDL
jgi:hypothetical protein